MNVEWVRAGEVLKLVRRPVTIDPLKTYRHIGVYSWGKGIIERAPTLGAELSKLAYFELPTNSLVLSNIQAWEAAIARSSEAHSDFIASQRFLSYTPIEPNRLDVDYVLNYLLSDHGMVQIRAASPGTVTRNRTLGIKAFENIRLPLPDTELQQSIARRISAVQILTSHHSSAGTAIPSLTHRSEVQYLERLPQIELGKIAEINPRPVRLSPDTSVRFVPMEAVDATTGRIADLRVIPKSSLRSQYKQFRQGDIIFARITPCMQNGKCAVIDADGPEVGYGSTEFHVVRTYSDDDRVYVHSVLRSQWFRHRAMKAFTGTAGQQRVPAEYLYRATVPDPRRCDVAEVVRKLGSFADTRRRTLTLTGIRASIETALPNAVRNDIFRKFTR